MQTRRTILKYGAFGAASALCPAFSGNGSSKAAETPSDLPKRDCRATLTGRWSRKTDCYTQGLVYEIDKETGRSVLYESGGRYGESLLRKCDAETGKVLQSIKIPRAYFAEGLAAVDDRLYMLTWQERTCFVYDKKTLKQIDEFRYVGEGWGLAYNGADLAMSDGSSTIRFLDPKTFRQKRAVNVSYTDKGGKKRPLRSLNELEYVDGELWANIYQQTSVARIDPRSGQLIGVLNFAGLVPKHLVDDYEYVLNGMAFDSERRMLYATGKRWPVMYMLSIEFSESKG